MITIIGGDNCRPCLMLKKILDKQIVYEYIILRSVGKINERASKLIEQTTSTRIPQLYINETYITSGLVEIVAELRKLQLIK